MGNEASIVAAAFQAKSKMSKALDKVDKSFQGQPVPKEKKDYSKMHAEREREFAERNHEKAKRMADLKEKWNNNKKTQQLKQSNESSISVSRLTSGKIDAKLSQTQTGSAENWWASSN